MASYGELRMKRRRITVPSLVMRMLPQTTNLEEFGNISGIGEHKKKKYGKEFINLIRKYSD